MRYKRQIILALFLALAICSFAFWTLSYFASTGVALDEHSNLRQSRLHQRMYSHHVHALANGARVGVAVVGIFIATGDRHTYIARRSAAAIRRFSVG
jgi:hypothetical protein